MRHGIQSAMVLAAGLLVACAAGPRGVRDEDSARIEEAMRPEAHPEIIPQGITLGDDAPPLASPGYAAAGSSLVVGPYARQHEYWRGGYGLGGYHSGHLHGSRSHSVRYHIHATPGGTSPGLLP